MAAIVGAVEASAGGRGDAMAWAPRPATTATVTAPTAKVDRGPGGGAAKAARLFAIAFRDRPGAAPASNETGGTRMTRWWMKRGPWTRSMASAASSQASSIATHRTRLTAAADKVTSAANPGTSAG